MLLELLTAGADVQAGGKEEEEKPATWRCC
jgi:hypothetical protein